MGVTVQVRDLDPGVQERLRAAAEKRGLSLSEFLRRELSRLADQVEVKNRLGGPFPALAKIGTQTFVDLTREDRDR